MPFSAAWFLNKNLIPKGWHYCRTKSQNKTKPRRGGITAHKESKFTFLLGNNTGARAHQEILTNSTRIVGNSTTLTPFAITCHMAGTFTQLHVQVVFAVQGRANLIDPRWKDELHSYIAGIIKAKEQKPIIVNGMPDHVHAFIGLRLSKAVSDLVRDIKNNSTNFINDLKLVKGRFTWQEGYGAFTYSRSQVEAVYQYILNQADHHKRKSFKEEYLQLLKEFDIEHNEKYLFDWLD
jgi:putative transposase